MLLELRQQYMGQLPWWDEAARYTAMLAQDPRALFTAAEAGEAATVEGLLQHAGCTVQDAKQDNKYTALHLAALNGHLDTVRALLQRGADIHAREKMQDTPLALALVKDHVEVVRLLLQSGADPSLKSKTGQTALHVGASWGALEGTKVLLTFSTAELAVKANNGKTPATYARDKGHQKVLQLLEAAEVKVAEEEQAAAAVKAAEEEQAAPAAA